MADPTGKIMHAEITIGNARIMLSDEFPDWGSVGPQSVGGSPVVLHVYVEDVDAVMAQAEKAGGTVTMPVDDQFWGDRYGKLDDPFGHHWAIATHTKDVSEAEMAEAAKAMFS